MMLYESHRSVSQPGTQNILVWRNSSDLLKHTQEMVTAQLRFRCQRPQSVLCLGARINPAHHSRHARLGRRQGAWIRLSAVPSFKRLHSEFNTDLLPRIERIVTAVTSGGFWQRSARAGD